MTDRYHKALRMSISVMRREQRHEESPYRFTRKNCPPGDTLHHDGMGEPVAYTGMSWSGFRPSDDACRYGYLVPSNLFAAKVLKDAAFLAGIMGDESLAGEARNLSAAISDGIRKYAIVNHPAFGDIFAYEVDGLGHSVLMDDANVPSLLSLPYLEAVKPDDPVYLNTRRFILSGENPYYYSGSAACGVGSPHTPEGYIWPIALCIQAMTSDNLDETERILHMLIRGHAGTGYMHESFDPDDPARFTRPWFAWANSMFGEMVYRLYEENKLSAVSLKS